MQTPTIKYFSLIFYILLLFADISSSVPCYNNYESLDRNDAENSKGQEYQIKNRSLDVRDLYEFLLKKQALEDQLSQSHQVIRKSNRSPSLRLRFGKKRDPYATNPQFAVHPYNILEDLEN